MTLNLDLALAVSIWIEALLYGVYACLFVETLFVLLRRKDGMTFAARFFFVNVIVMFLLATAHVAVNLFRFINGFVFMINPSSPAAYLLDYSRKENVAMLVMTSVMIWLGDILVIYRCYLVWNRKIWVTIIPILLLILGIGSNAAIFLWIRTPSIPNIIHIGQWLGTVYPVSFAQNTITTGMIAYKVWSQHRLSKNVGVRNTGATLDLLDILRIIVESAMIYTLQELALIILYELESNGQYLLSGAVVPSIGMVFSLIAVRVHLSRSNLQYGRSMMDTIPGWLADDTNANSSRSSVNFRHSVALPARSMDGAANNRLKDGDIKGLHIPDSDTSTERTGETSEAIV